MAGMLAGALGGALANQREGGKNAQNMYQLDGAPGFQATDYLHRMQAAQDAAGNTNLGTAANEVGQNSILGQLFGQGGTLDRTTSEEQRLASDPNQLTSEDRSAYGQASGDIARQFGEQEQSMAQALANRGMSSSGAAGAQFSGLQGNKMEQLAQVQRKIADDRLKTNMSRLNDTRQFLGQMGGQAQGALQNTYKNQEQKQNTMYDQNQGMLDRMQGQANEALSQQQQTEHGSNLANMFQGARQGKQEDDSNMKSMGSMAGMFSDSRVKKNIKRLKTSLYRNIPTYTYEYISPEFGPAGPQTGVLAQDLIKAGLDNKAVKVAPNGYYTVQYEMLERA